MSVGESDGVRELVGEHAQAAIVLAVTISRRVNAQRQRQLEQAQHESAANVAALNVALRRDRALQVASASAVLDDAWWTPERTPDEVAEMWQPIAETIARDPQGADSTLQRAAERIASESRDRWGIDVIALTHLARAQELEREQQTLTARGASDSTVAAALARVEKELQRARTLTPEPQQSVVTDAAHEPAEEAAAKATPAAASSGRGGDERVRDQRQRPVAVDRRVSGREPYDRLEVLASSLQAAGVRGEDLEARMLAEAAFSGGPERSLGAGNLRAQGRAADRTNARELKRHR